MQHQRLFLRSLRAVDCRFGTSGPYRRTSRTCSVYATRFGRLDPVFKLQVLIRELGIWKCNLMLNMISDTQTDAQYSAGEILSLYVVSTSQWVILVRASKSDIFGLSEVSLLSTIHLSSLQHHHQSLNQTIIKRTSFFRSGCQPLSGPSAGLPPPLLAQLPPLLRKIFHRVQKRSRSLMQSLLISSPSHDSMVVGSASS